jgi:hypothetical protein
MIPPINEVKNPHIARFEAACIRQMKHNKVNALRMRIGAGAAAIGSLGCAAVLISAGVGAIAVGLALPVAAILVTAVATTMVALAFLGIGLAAMAHEKRKSPSFGFLGNDRAIFLPILDYERRASVQVKLLGRYGVISEETLLEISDFERRLRAIPGAVIEAHKPQFDAEYNALKKEWQDVLIPKMQADLPYPNEGRMLTLKAYEIYKTI